MSEQKWMGWVGESPDAVNGKMVWKEIPNGKKWTEDDVDIEVSHCGICGSELHTLRSGWGESAYPLIVGHEIVGKAIRVGKNVKDINVGDRVGVGAQQNSCLKPDCEECSSGLENHCAGMKATYNSKYEDGTQSQGGYATHHRTNSRFAIKIPDSLPSEEAAPMMCGGVTVYSPLKRYGAGPGKKVGIIGVGGLGHFGILFAKALGADKVVGISRSASKRDDALKLGADEYIATSDDKDWAKHHARSLDLIICTVSSANMPFSEYLQLLRPLGRFVQVGVPEEKLPKFHAFEFIANGVSITGSAIGSPDEIKEMLQLAADKKVKPWIEKVPMKEANKAIVDMDAGKARYRYTLCN